MAPNLSFPIGNLFCPFSSDALLSLSHLDFTPEWVFLIVLYSNAFVEPTFSALPVRQVSKESPFMYLISISSVTSLLIPSDIL